MIHPVKREEMVALDRWAIHTLGIPGTVLMENAGRGVAEEASRMVPDSKSGSILILAGKGNNGGDGFVAARHLWSRGYAVKTRVLGALDQYPEGSDARIHLEILRNLRLDIAPLVGGTLAGLTSEVSLIIDGLFGTGLQGAPRSPADAVIREINEIRATGIQVLAVDIPSGLDCNSGDVPGVAVIADRTITFDRAKVGFIQGQGPAHTGTVVVADISIPPAGPDRPDVGQR